MSSGQQKGDRGLGSWDTHVPTGTGHLSCGKSGPMRAPGGKDLMSSHVPSSCQAWQNFPVHKEHPVTVAVVAAKAKGGLRTKEQGFKADPKPGLRRRCSLQQNWPFFLLRILPRIVLLSLCVIVATK